MQHTEKCLKMRSEMAAERIAWELEHDNFCESCGGTGWYAWNESVPYGIGNISMPMAEFCSRCIGENKCPACGTELTCQDDAEVITCSCGYNSETNCAGVPEVLDEYDCNCF